MYDQYEEFECCVGSNGKCDNDPCTSWFVTTAGEMTGLSDTVFIERCQILEVISDLSPCTGSPHYRRDRICKVLLAPEQVEVLGWDED